MNKFSKTFWAAVSAVILTGTWYLLASNGIVPGLVSSKSTLFGKHASHDHIDEHETSDGLLPAPDIDNAEPSKKSMPAVTVATTKCFTAMPLYAACGRDITTAGSLMEKYGVNTTLVVKTYAEMRDAQLDFIEHFANGVKSDQTPGVTLAYIPVEDWIYVQSSQQHYLSIATDSWLRIYNQI